MMEQELTHAQKTARYLGAFFDELVRCGVHDVVVSPGSRSTGLAMTAFELSCRRPDDLRVHVDVDERGASFVALGLAKATGRPAALVCTSGTAPANYFPAVMEAQTSRVPLLVLSSDRPEMLLGLGAPQTSDQVKLFGDAVRLFRQMPEPDGTPKAVAFARQAAREACIAALGRGRAEDSPASAAANTLPGVAANANESTPPGAASAANTPGSADVAANTPADVPRCVVVASRGCAQGCAPVHLNFPLDEPLKPDFSLEGLFEDGRSPLAALACAPASGPDKAAGTSAAAAGAGLRGAAGPLAGARAVPDAGALRVIEALVAQGGVAVLAGEGTCETLAEAREVVAWAERWGLPLLADPLSGLRAVDAACVIDSYDNLFAREDCPLPRAVIRFGRWPLSKRAFNGVAAARPVQVVADACETRDFNLMTDLFIPCTPLDLVRAMTAPAVAPAAGEKGEKGGEGGAASFCASALASGLTAQAAYLARWVALNDAERPRIEAARAAGDGFEGAYLSALLERVPAGSLLFSANSLSVRALDTFLLKPAAGTGDRPLAVLANRGQNGIDGVASTAIGAAWAFPRATFVTGDLTFLHDLNALHLQRELLHAAPRPDGTVPSLTIVLLNNNGGGLFDMLPQQSEEPYFERLFLVPHDARFGHAADAFGVPYRAVDRVDDMVAAYEELSGIPGLSLIEVSVPLAGVKSRYAPYQG